ncbi:integrase [Streptomyces sp. LX-29]|nr:integrase [Streptomyces sp. LX-29]WFB07931.1 integrase [Streptomyces sp. LX-29]
MGHPHISVTATVCIHVRLHLPRQAINALGDALGPNGNRPEDPPVAATVR